VAASAAAPISASASAAPCCDSRLGGGRFAGGYCASLGDTGQFAEQPDRAADDALEWRQREHQAAESNAQTDHRHRARDGHGCGIEWL
jgi:hypothetical protein